MAWQNTPTLLEMDYFIECKLMEWESIPSFFPDSFTGCDGTGYVYDCCSSSNPCGVFEGDCDGDEDCFGHLLCGKDKCHNSFPSDVNCCYNPFTSK